MKKAAPAKKSKTTAKKPTSPAKQNAETPPMPVQPGLTKEMNAELAKSKISIKDIPRQPDVSKSADRAEPKGRKMDIDALAREHADWRSILIYGYGETQVAGRIINKKVDNSTLKSLPALIENLSSMQKENTSISLEEAHYISIANNSSITFVPRSVDKSQQVFSWSEINQDAVNKLWLELQAQSGKQLPIMDANNSLPSNRK